MTYDFSYCLKYPSFTYELPYYSLFIGPRVPPRGPSHARPCQHRDMSGTLQRPCVRHGIHEGNPWKRSVFTMGYTGNMDICLAGASFYPEKYESVGITKLPTEWKKENVPSHQPEIEWEYIHQSDWFKQILWAYDGNTWWEFYHQESSGLTRCQ